MDVHEWTVKYHGRKSEYHLYPLGDIHIGTVHCTEDEIRKQVSIIKDDPYGLWIGMGDYAELITPGDKRWNWGVVSDWVNPHNIGECQRKRVRAILEPIKDQCIGMLEGNHEVSMKLYNHYDFMENITEDLGVRKLGYSCYMRFIFQRTKTESQQFKGVFTHGSGWAITKGAKLNKLRRFMDDFEADIYGFAHLHDILREPKPYMALNDANKIKQRLQWGAMTGCWFLTYKQDVPASYGEMRTMPPTAIGCPVFTITPYTREVDV